VLVPGPPTQKKKIDAWSWHSHVAGWRVGGDFQKGGVGNQSGRSGTALLGLSAPGSCSVLGSESRLAGSRSKATMQASFDIGVGGHMGPYMYFV